MDTLSSLKVYKVDIDLIRVLMYISDPQSCHGWLINKQNKQRLSKQTDHGRLHKSGA
jgi:hypothetical protein